jgi:hypothetical protein
VFFCHDVTSYYQEPDDGHACRRDVMAMQQGRKILLGPFPTYRGMPDMGSTSLRLASNAPEA